MARSPKPLTDVHDRLLDREALETPRRLSRDEHRALVGPDWVWTQPDLDEENTRD